MNYVLILHWVPPQFTLNTASQLLCARCADCLINFSHLWNTSRKTTTKYIFLSAFSRREWCYRPEHIHSTDLQHRATLINLLCWAWLCNCLSWPRDPAQRCERMIRRRTEPKTSVFRLRVASLLHKTLIHCPDCYLITDQLQAWLCLTNLLPETKSRETQTIFLLIIILMTYEILTGYKCISLTTTYLYGIFLSTWK